MKHCMLMGMTVLGAAAVLASGPVDAEEANHSDHDALRHIRVVFEDAVARNDMERLRPYLATNFSMVTFTDREFTDFEAFKTQWQKTRDTMLGKRGSYRVDLDPEYSVLMEDIALCRGNAHNVLIDGKGREFKFDAHWSVVCQKQDGQWKIVRGHNSLNPFQNPMVRHGATMAVIKTAALAFLLGLVAGVVGVRRFRRG